jgi:hypothetical protein
MYLDGIDTSNIENMPEFISNQINEVYKLLSGLSEEKANYSYAEGKWTIKQLIGHIADSVRVFSYRIMCLARGEQNTLPGFNENTYAKNSNADKRSIKSLTDEFIYLNKSLLLLMESMDDEALSRKGIVNIVERPGYKNEFTVRGLLFVNAIHIQHHILILKKKYLKV